MEFAEIDAQAKGYTPEPLELIFSENQGHDYDGMFAYFETLSMQARLNRFHLKPKRWIPEMMDRSHWSVEPHNKLAGLQLADILASAFLQGANSAANNHNPAQGKSLSPIMARDAKGRVDNAGVTLWPLKSQAQIPVEARPLFEHFGYRF